VNQGQLDLPSKVDHLVIGTAIHWVQQESLRRMVEQNLQPGAKIFVTHRLIRLEDQPYFAPLSEVDSKYGRRRPSVDLWGKAKLQACGYQAADQVQIRRQFKFGIEFIYKNQLSHLYRDFYLNVTDKFDEYRSDVYDALTPFLVNDRLTGTLVNWGIIHVPRAA
jgi:hypothetical protein